MIVAAGHSSIGFFLTLYFLEVRQMSAIAATAAFLPFLIPLPLAGLLAGRLVVRISPPTMAAAGLGLAAVGLLLVGQMGVDTAYAGALLAGLLIFPLGAALTFSGATVMAVEDVDGDRAGLAGGLLNTAVELGPTAGLSALVALAGTRTGRLVEAGEGALEATTAGYSVALITAAAVFAVAAVGLTALGRHPRTGANTRSTGGDIS